MKVLVVSSLSIFLLAGCDNFQLLKPLSSVQKLDTHGKVQNTSTDTNPQAGDQNASDAPPIHTGPVQIPAMTESAFDQSGGQSGQSSGTLIIPPRTSTPDSSTTNPSTNSSSDQAQTPKADTAAPTTSTVSATPTTTATSTTSTAPTAATTEKSAAASSPASKPTEGANVITVVEHLNLAAVLNKTFGSDYMSATKPVLPTSTQGADFTTKFSGSIEKFTYGIMNKEQMMIEFNDVEINISGLSTFSKQGYELTAVCTGAKCDILFVTISKFDDKGKALENYPLILKLVKGEYQKALFKKKEEYEADRNSTSNQNSIKLVPQLAVTQKLHEHIEAHGGQLVELLQEQLKKTSSLVYSDLVIGHSSMNTKKFIPRFSREGGKLMVTAQLEYFSPKNPLLFKGEVKPDTVSGPIASSTGLSMYLYPRVKDEIYLLLMHQRPYKSKIANIDSAVQALVCSVLEEENNQFSDCMIIPASVVFGESNVIEGSTQDKIKEAGQ